MRLGIDFGTTRTVVAAARDGRYPVASFKTAQGFVDFLPGAAAFQQSGIVCGEDARNAPAARKVRSVKERVSDTTPDTTIFGDGQEAISALGLTTEYLRFVRSMIFEKSNLQIAEGEPLEVTAAVPAHASTRQRYLTIEAFTAAGFDVVGLVNEPTAGAVEYVHHCLGQLKERSPKRYVVVYDLGGGTFDTAAVSLKERRFDLIGAEGLNHLGGNFFDEVIATHALRSAGISRSGLSEDHWAQLLEHSREAKEGLSPNAKKILIEAQDIFDEDLVVDLAPIYEECQPWIEQTLGSMDHLLDGLRAHGIDPDNTRELGAIYLVGGSSLFPPVQKALRKRFGRKVQIAPQPHASTAIGLAISSDEDAGIFVREAPTRHFGVWREQQCGVEKVFDPIIEKKHGAEVTGPIQVERVYRPTHAVGRLRFVECTDLDQSYRPGGEVTPWESVLFPYDPGLQGCENLSEHLNRKDESLMGAEIIERYNYESTGVVRVFIENRTHGYAREYVLGKPGNTPSAGAA